MRDIREDLQERINLLSDQLSSVQAQFDRQAKQIQEEHDNRLKGLKADLEAVNKLIGAEQRRLGDTPQPASKPKPQPQKTSGAQSQQPPKARPRMPLAQLMGLQRAS